MDIFILILSFEMSLDDSNQQTNSWPLLTEIRFMERTMDESCLESPSFKLVVKTRDNFLTTIWMKLTQFKISS